MKTTRKSRNGRAAQTGRIQGSGAVADGAQAGKPARSAGAPGKHLVVVGLGNIGSHLIVHLARLLGVTRLTLIDPDRYESENLTGQDITAADIGRAKAVVQARRARRINPALAVHPIVDEVQNVPLGCLRADLVLACLDSRQARCAVNLAAWRLGIPWIDAGVEASGLLVRVAVIVPGPEAACYECAFDPADYEAISDTYSCNSEAGAPAPTNAPSSLGALAASLQAIESRKLLAGQTDAALVGREVMFDATWHRHFVTGLVRNPACRFDHATWRIEPINSDPAEVPIGRVLTLAPRTCHGEVEIAVEGKPFVRVVICPGCGRARKVSLRLAGRLHRVEQQCDACGRLMVVSGFDAVERLGRVGLTRASLKRSMSSFGFRPGDVFVLFTGDVETHFQIGAL